MLQYLYWFYRLFSYLMSKLQNQMWVYNNEKNPLQWISVLKMGTFIEMTDLKSLTYAVIYEFLKSIVMLLVLVGFRFGIWCVLILITLYTQSCVCMLTPA